jgi:glycerol-3-phosphate acyltransferase PlsY
MQDLALAPVLLLGAHAVRWVLTLLVWLVSLALLAPVCFFAAISLAGPHGGVRPPSVQPLVLILGWAIVLVVPVLIARVAWRHASNPDSGRVA